MADRFALVVALLCCVFAVVVLTWYVPVMLRQGWVIGGLTVVVVVCAWANLGLMASEIKDDFRRHQGRTSDL